MTSSRSLLERLVACPSVVRTPTGEVLAVVAAALRDAGIEPRIVPSPAAGRDNLLAVIGPADVPGIVLSGHIDVVTAEGQAWSVPPFELTERDGRLYGRGTSDMKGFVASAIATAIAAARAGGLTAPLILAISCDEEAGCLGVPTLLDEVACSLPTPRLVVIGEPTQLQVVTAHKGKRSMRAHFRGRPCHSGYAPEGVNAVEAAARLVLAIVAEQERLLEHGARDEAFDIPFTTVMAGPIKGGTVLNVVPDRCTLEFEVRNLPEDDPDAIAERLLDRARELGAELHARADEAGVEVETFAAYPAMRTPADGPEARLVAELAGAGSGGAITFGTEGGLFRERLGAPTVVCGPGDIGRAHRPDEWLGVDELAACDALLGRLAATLSG